MKANNTPIVVISFLVGVFVFTKTDSYLAALALFAAIVAIATTEILRMVTSVTVIGIRIVGSVAVTWIRAMAQMYAERQRTERDQARWSARVGVERARHENVIIRNAAASSQARLKAKRQALAAKEQATMTLPAYNDLIDVDYTVVDEE